MKRTITDHGLGSKHIVEQYDGMKTHLRAFIEKDMMLYQGYHTPEPRRIEVGFHFESQRQVESAHRSFLW